MPELAADTRLKRQMHDQIRFMQLSAKNYDAGEKIEAKRLALACRVLLYDTDYSQSVLRQLDIKHTILFLDTARLHAGDGAIATRDLQSLQTEEDMPGSYTPLLDTFDSAEPMPFHSWWGAAFLQGGAGFFFNRKQIVLYLANKDGGAHVDPSDPDQMPDGHHSQDTEQNLIFPAMRQITYEILKSLYPGYSDFFDETYF